MNFTQPHAAEIPDAEGSTLPLRRLAVVDMAEGAAHDLKNQLTVVVTAVQMVREHVAAEDAALLDRAVHAAMRAASQMDELLRLARGSGANAERADVTTALETAVAGTWGYCAARGVQLELRAAADLPLVAGSLAGIQLVLLHSIRAIADRLAADSRLVAEAVPHGAGVAVLLRALNRQGQEVGASNPPWPASLRELATDAGLRLGQRANLPAVYLPTERGPQGAESSRHDACGVG